MYFSISILMASRPSHAAVVYPFVMLYLVHMFSIIIIYLKNDWWFAPVWLLVLWVSCSGAGGWYSWMAYFPTFDDEVCCAPSIFGVTFTNYNHCALFNFPGDVYFCRLIGLVLGIPYVGGQGFGRLLKVMNYCILWPLRGDLLWG